MASKFTGALAAALLSLGLAACNQQAPTAEAPPAATAAAPTEFTTRSFREARIETNGNVFTVHRGDDLQGLSIVPNQGAGPVRVDFAVSGRDARVRVYREGQWRDLPVAPTYALRLGAGGAFHINVIPGQGQAAVVTFTGSTDCASVPAAQCPALAP